MKHGPEYIDDNPQNVKRFKTAHKITKSLEELLQEVSVGQYENFRSFLVQEKISNLKLSENTTRNVDLSHLGKALEGTQVIILDLYGNKIGAVRALELIIGLNGHNNVSTLELGDNNIGVNGARHLCLFIKYTHVNSLGLSLNNFSPMDTWELKGITTALRGSNVTNFDLSDNSIFDEGAVELIIGLQGTAVTHLLLKRNFIYCINFHAEAAQKLDTYVQNTALLNVELGYSIKALKNALVLNKFMKISYAAICLTHLQESEKKKHYHLPALDTNSSKENEIEFAGGILSCLGTYFPVLQAAIISYLPRMNMERAQKLQELANIRHGYGRQVKVKKEITKIEESEETGNDQKRNSSHSWCSIQ